MLLNDLLHLHRNGGNFALNDGGPFDIFQITHEFLANRHHLLGTLGMARPRRAMFWKREPWRISSFSQRSTVS